MVEFKRRDIVSIRDLSREEIEVILDEAMRLKKGEAKPKLAGKIMASCFFEPSTRTRLSLRPL